HACLLFLDVYGEDFTTLFCQPRSKNNPLSHLRLSRQNPIIKHLGREKKLLAGESLATLPSFRSLREEGAGKIKLDEIELFLPLISRHRLIGILVLGKKQSGSYSPEDFSLLTDVADQVAVSMEKEYLREQLAQLYAEAAEKARVDELTGLFNRRSLNEVMASEISRYSRYGGVFSLIILDLDLFKAYNDTYGHLAGDELLRQIGGITRKAIRNSDQAFRYGGDEFAILLPNTSTNAATQVAERVRKQVVSKVIADDIQVTISLGLATWPGDGREANELIAAADAALYYAKQNGGNQSYRAANL
ncbi:MAG: GGDEF domain-containing protein, partial [Chloroflexi bacterium]|nr:GGDEF domain-containing protein [Chloroflexota bacterium]